MDGFIFKRAKFYSDFFLPQFNSYVEYWGLAYAERSYVQKMKYKVDYYRRHNLRLVSIYPNNMSDLDAFLKQEFPVSYPQPSTKYCTRCGQRMAKTDAYCSSCGHPLAA